MHVLHTLFRAGQGERSAEEGFSTSVPTPTYLPLQPQWVPIHYVPNMDTVLTNPNKPASTLSVRPRPHQTSTQNRVSVKTGTVDAGTDGVVNAGDVVSYTFEVTNTGHTCLAVLSIVDDNAGMVDCPYVMDMAGEEPWLDSFRISTWGAWEEILHNTAAYMLYAFRFTFRVSYSFCVN